MEINYGTLIYQALMLMVFFGIGAYLLVLIFKLVNRGIKALDIYIKKNESKDS